MEASGLTGFEFQPVHKAAIVDLRWEQWDLTTNEPPEYPESGEPEDYILGRRSSAKTAKEIGDIWELVVPATAKIGRPRRIVDSFRELYVELGSWNGADVFRGDGCLAVLTTEPAKLWFEEHLWEYVDFQEFDCR
jgi:hypothetical protein